MSTSVAGGRPVAQLGVAPDRVRVPSPAFEDDLSVSQSVEDLALEQFGLMYQEHHVPRRV